MKIVKYIGVCLCILQIIKFVPYTAKTPNAQDLFVIIDQAGETRHEITYAIASQSETIKNNI